MRVTKTLLTAGEFDNYPFEEDKRYELVDPESHEVEIWTGAALPGGLTSNDTLTSGLLPGFQLPLPNLFD
jgi:hypothetical protein